MSRPKNYLHLRFMGPRGTEAERGTDEAPDPTDGAPGAHSDCVSLAVDVDAALPLTWLLAHRDAWDIEGAA